MNTVKVELEVGKESKEVFDLVAELIKDIKAKKAYGELAAENFPLLVKAIEGVSDIPAEFKSQYMADTASYGAGSIVKALLA